MANSNDYGFYALKDLQAQRVATVGTSRVYDAVRETTAEYNRVAQELMNEWSVAIEAAQLQFELAGAGTMQPLDEHGNPLPVKPSGAYQVGFPIQGAGTAWGDNRITRELMTVEEVQRATMDALRRDADWLTRHMLAALLDNTTWTFNDKIGPDGSGGLGDVTVQPLANGDTVVYGRKGVAGASTDDHYYAQDEAIADASNPYPTIRAELLEHPSNMNADVTAYISTSLVATTQALASFNEVRNRRLIYGNGVTLAVGDEFTDTGVGSTVLGDVAGVRIVEWAALPAGYLIAKVDGKRPLAMREYPAAALKGLFTEDFNQDGNHKAYRWLRYAGFGVLDRVAAVVGYIGTSDTYAIPTGYATPLPA